MPGIGAAAAEVAAHRRGAPARSSGCGFAASSAVAETTCPAGAEPALERILLDERALQRRERALVAEALDRRHRRSPRPAAASRMHESTARPSTSTVQAPQVPSAHAILVPVSPTCSRSSSASVAPSGTRAAPCAAVERERDLAHASTVSAWAWLSRRQTRPRPARSGGAPGTSVLGPPRPHGAGAAHELGLLVEALLDAAPPRPCRGSRRARAARATAARSRPAMYIVARMRAYEVLELRLGERRRARRRPAPVEQPERVVAQHPAQQVVAGAAHAGRAHEHVERRERLAVRDVGGPQDLLRRHERHQVELVERRPRGAVEEDVLDAARELADAGLGDDRGVREDQRGVGIALGDVPELQRHAGRQTAAGVDQHRQLALVREREDGLEPRIVDA